MNYMPLWTKNKTLLLVALNVEFAALAFFAIYSIYGLVDYRKEHDLQIETEVKRYKSILLADQLRQSSDDLTRMVRSYVVTGDPIYAKYFDEILDIRSGRSSMPENYNRIYWDFKIVERDHIKNEQGVKKSLRDLFYDVGISESERRLLTIAEERSNRLANIEHEAIIEVKEKTSSIINQNNYFPTKKLVNMVFGHYYNETKKDIMAPIDLFLYSVEKRTYEELNDIQEKTALYLNRLVYGSIISGAIFLAMLATYFRYRKVLVLALAETEQRFRSMFENHDAIMLLVDPLNGRVVDANIAAQTFYGYSLQEFKQLSMGQISCPEVGNSNDEIPGSEKIEQPVSQSRHFVSNGETRDVEVHSTPIEFNSRSFLFSIIHDVTERNRLIESQKRLAQMAAIGELAANIAHEINNPAQAIISFAELIVEEPGDEGLVRQVSPKIAREGIRIGEIVKAALHYSRSGVQDKKLCDVRKILNDAIFLLKGKIGKEKIELVVNSDEKVPLVSIVSREIEQVIINLVGNSIDALNELNEAEREKKEIVISLKFEKRVRLVELCIFDNGPGIPERMKNTVKDAFFTTKEVGKGTGLGLSIVDGIMTSHGGRFEIQSVEGEFTKAILYFPVDAS